MCTLYKQVIPCNFKTTAKLLIAFFDVNLLDLYKILWTNWQKFCCCCLKEVWQTTTSGDKIKQLTQLNVLVIKLTNNKVDLLWFLKSHFTWKDAS